MCIYISMTGVLNEKIKMRKSIALLEDDLLFVISDISAPDLQLQIACSRKCCYF